MPSKKKGDAPRKGTVHFTLGENLGELLTETVRDIAWNECKEGEAIIMLVDSLHGFTTDQARDVIHGRKKLVTKDDGHLNLVKDEWTPPDLEAMKQEALDMLNWVNTHEPKAPKHPLGGTWFERLPPREQSEYILRSSDIRQLLELNVRKGHSKAKALHQEMLDRNESFSRYMSDDYYDEEMEERSPAKKAIDDIAEAGLSDDMYDKLMMNSISHIATSNLPEDVKRDMIMASKGKTEAWKKGGDIEIKRDPNFENETGWLTPNGTYYGFIYGQHIYVVDRLAEMHYPDEFDKDKMDAEGFLEDKGWAKCGNRKWYLCAPFTKEQKKTFNKWKERWGEPREMTKL